MLTLVCCGAARDAIDCQSYFTKVGKTKLMPIPLEVPLLPLPPPLLPLTTTNTSPPSTPCVPCQNVNKHTQTATGTATGSCTCRRIAPTHHKTQARAAISRRFPRQVASGKWQARHAEVFPALSVRTRRCRRQHVQSSSVRSEFKTDVKSTRVRDYAYAALATAAPIRSLFLCAKCSKNNKK